MKPIRSKYGRSSKLVYPAAFANELIVRKHGLPKEWTENLRDSNYSAIVTGRSGSGKDCLTQALMDNDIRYKRTIIIMDVKMEYPFSIFAQRDLVLKNILAEQGLIGRGYKVNLWIPYTQGLDKNEHFMRLLNLKHPNLRVRPFRILKSSLISEDTANMALGKTATQSLADKNVELKGSSKMTNEVKEQIAKMKLAIDDTDISDATCGWEYINFDEMSANGEVNVIATYFMMGMNAVAGISFMIAVMNELMTIGKSVHRQREESELFTIVIPEVQIILPKRVKALDAIVNTLKHSMMVGFLLMRSFGVRVRMNLQNMSALDPDMLSQSRLFFGRTRNPKDLNLLNIFGVNKSKRLEFMKLSVGNFIDVSTKKKFSVVPFSHKARENEYLVKALAEFNKFPSNFLYETETALFSEIVHHHSIFKGRPLTVSEYDRRVKDWLAAQPEAYIDEIDLQQAMDVDDIEVMAQRFEANMGAM